jgi:uncharacterized protein (TIGR02646 family)
MRRIQKSNEPRRLIEWRAAHRHDVNFGYDLIDPGLRREIRHALVAEQRGLCAYTGQRIGTETCHIEHPKAQVHCVNGEDVAYSNMLACVPAPNAPALPYGAHRKGAWPGPTQAALFVSPLRPGCGDRFAFSLRGEMTPRNAGDNAAAETIRNLALDHAALTQLRKAAIDGTLGRPGRGPASLDLRTSRRRLTGLTAAEAGNGPLEPFSFVLVQALERHVRRLQVIHAGRRGQR